MFAWQACPEDEHDARTNERMEPTPASAPRASVTTSNDRLRAPSLSAVSLALHGLRRSARATAWRGSHEIR
jgi:hypothetical protein